MITYLIKTVSLSLALGYLTAAGVVTVNARLGRPPLTELLDPHDSILMFLVASWVYLVSRAVEHQAGCE